MKTEAHFDRSNPPGIDVPKDHAYDGIQEFDNPLPRWWLWTFAITVIFAIFYWMWLHSLPNGTLSFAAYGEEQAEYDLKMLANAVDPAVVVTASKDPATVERGKALFTERCVSCHAAEGQGQVGPNLTDKFWIHGGDVKSIYMTVAGGYPKLGMPEWRTVLEDNQLVDVVAFVLSIRNTEKAGKAPQGESYSGE